MRKTAIGALGVFLAGTGVYIFVYLWRAFRIDGPNETTVRIWHGDDWTRAMLVSIFFLIGLTILGFLWVLRATRERDGHVRVRRDLLDWLAQRAERSGESVDRVTERAVAAYRDRLEGDLESEDLAR